MTTTTIVCSLDERTDAMTAEIELLAAKTRDVRKRAHALLHEHAGYFDNDPDLETSLEAADRLGCALYDLGDQFQQTTENRDYQED